MATVFPGKVEHPKGITTQVSVDNVHDTTPTLTQINTAFGAPTSVGAGFMGVINDAAGGTNFYVCASDGTNWFYSKLTKAV